LDRRPKLTSIAIRILAVAAVAAGFTLAAFAGIKFGEAVSTPSGSASPPVAEKPERSRPTPAEAKPKKSRVSWPAKGAEDEAQKIAEDRDGLVSFAAIGPSGRTMGFDAGRPFFSASVSKAMLLVAELRRLRREDLPLDDATRATLTQMITLSDNVAADAIYARVGDAGLNEVAKVAGMTDYSGDVGHWSNVQFSAGDLALFMSELDELLALQGGEAGSKMLSSVISTQRWGVPQAAPGDARIRFKGGWRPSDSGELVHQMARVDVNGKSYSLAVMTDGNPSQPYGEKTIRLIAAELLETDKR